MNHLPSELLQIGPRDIKRVFANPTLIRITGRREPPLFVSVLLHGNETVGFFVLQDLARLCALGAPPRSLLIFVGNVDATAAGVRRADHQPDFNRIWAGGDGPAFALARSVIDEVAAARPFASIDVHNNTGINPFYGCVNSLDAHHLNLAALFSRIAVYHRNPPTTQSMALSRFCASVTIECGRIDNAAGIARACEFVHDVMHLDHIPDRAPPHRDLTLFHTLGRVIVDPERSFSFTADDVDLKLRHGLETCNFSQMAANEVWGHCRGAGMPLRVIDDDGRDTTERFFQRVGASLSLRQPVIPAMITLDERVIRQDCLGYLMTAMALAPH